MSLLFAFAALACTGSGPKGSYGTGVGADDPMEWALSEPGPYAAGFESWAVTYSPGEAFGPRTIRLNVWYPTVSDSGPPARYTFGVDDESIEGATPAAPIYADGHPVHAFSHGSQAIGESSAFMSRHLASHGWVTVAPNHTQNTLIDHQDPLPSAHYFHRPLDIRAALDAIETLPSTHPLAGLVNTERVMLSGHSFGAYTTWASLGAGYDLEQVAEMCATGAGIHDDSCTEAEQAMFGTDLSDERVVASMPMAGTLRRSWFGETGEQSVHGPVLFMGATNDERGQQEQFDSMGPIDFTWMEIGGGCHETFALGTCSTLDREVGYRIVRTVGLAWARHTVLADGGAETRAVLDGSHDLLHLVATQSN